MYTMSTESRKYELKARAEGQRETREQIARAAAELHEEKGVASTTVVEIARRASVSRLTVYNHFADLDQLLPACSEHYESRHPLPDFDPALSLPDPADRVREVLTLLYRWYREVEPMFGKLFSDRSSVPELDRFMSANIDRLQADLAAGLATSLSPGRPPKSLRALLRVALDFWTWSRLAGEGLSDSAAAKLMAGAVT
jgi:AcrR family transcriptional regulator